jgi:CDP-glycerol glycerophosphotransferase (TagB/SpsB family)
MFSMLKEIMTNPKFEKYNAVFVVTKNTKDTAKKRMSFYGFERVTLCERNSREYCKYLATAKYLMTDNSFPPYFNKREQQVFLNTWHGTPLKTLGKSDKSFLGSTANIQKNYIMSDYALFPNHFTKNVFMEDYDLKYIFSSKSLIANYPRNYIFYNSAQGESVKKELGLDGKRVFAYMPTWRGTDRSADTKKQIATVVKILKEFDEKLSDNEVLLVNLHFLLAQNIDCSKFKHIQYFNSSYDTYEVLNACDGLITDYSSVFFDFAVTGKKIILLAYDKDEYFETRGVYIPFEQLPFPITENVEATINEMRESVSDYSDFVKEYCPNGSYTQCCDLFDMMINGTSQKFEIVQHKTPENLCVIYAGNFNEYRFDSISKYIDQHPQYECVVAYKGNISEEKKEFVNSLSGRAGIYGIISAYQFTFSQLVSILIHKCFKKITVSKTLDKFFKRTANHRFYSIKPMKIVDFFYRDYVTAGMFAKLSGEKEFHIHGDYYVETKKRMSNEAFVKSFEKGQGFNEINDCQAENSIYIENNADNAFADSSFRTNSKFKNIIPFYISNSKGLKWVSLYRFKTPIDIAMKDVFVTVADENFDIKIIGNKNKMSKKHSGIIVCKIPGEKILSLPSNNKLLVCYKNKFDKVVQIHPHYFSPIGSVFLGLRSTMFRDKETNTVAIFRQSVKNRLGVYVRSFITSDKLIERIKQCVAYFMSLFWHSKKANSLVLLYEKNSSKYEESASVLFEKLIDAGYNNAYFIVDRNYQYFDTIPKKYLPNILYKNSFKHYLYFFKSNTFIGTETMVHSIDLKIFNVLPLKKIADKNVNYVFLQHGVMYMVSLDSESRTFFKPKKLNGKYRVVVSSQAEADHFVELGRHKYEQLYISGLPKFDKNTLNDDADKIVIMPTWRPWEINMARDNFLETSYFKMIMKIYNSVPDNLKDKVIILPHPLIVNELKNLPKSITDTILMNVKYDDVLKQARILITDYSSIAYDSFYRGTRVIFYWEEKDFCMEQYGPSTKLMLNEQNVFGDYFYSTDGLTQSIEFNYNNPQSEEHKQKYSQIVTYHDGKNTERLIEFLKKDNII